MFPGPLRAWEPLAPSLSFDVPHEERTVGHCALVQIYAVFFNLSKMLLQETQAITTSQGCLQVVANICSEAHDAHMALMGTAPNEEVQMSI